MRNDWRDFDLRVSKKINKVLAYQLTLVDAEMKDVLKIIHCEISKLLRESNGKGLGKGWCGVKDNKVITDVFVGKTDKRTSRIWKDWGRKIKRVRIIEGS